MIRPTFRQALVRRTLAVLRMVWGALFVMVLGYVALAVWLTQRLPAVFPSDIQATLAPAVYAIAVALALLLVWWRRLLGPERCVADASVSATAPGLPVAPETDAERLAVGAVGRFQTSTVIVWALSEAIAIFGFVLSLGAGDARHVTGLAAASLILLAMHAPSARRVEAIVAAVPDR